MVVFVSFRRVVFIVRDGFRGFKEIDVISKSELC